MGRFKAKEDDDEQGDAGRDAAGEAARRPGAGGGMRRQRSHGRSLLSAGCRERASGVRLDAGQHQRSGIGRSRARARPEYDLGGDQEEGGAALSYQVEWRPAAEREFQRLWRSVTNPIPVGVAAEQIDKKLSEDPDEKGESRAFGRRIFF